MAEQEAIDKNGRLICRAAAIQQIRAALAMLRDKYALNNNWVTMQEIIGEEMDFLIEDIASLATDRGQQ